MRTSKRKQSNSTLPLIMIGVGVILIIVFLAIRLSTGENQAQSSNTPSTASDIPFPEIARVSLSDAKSALDNQSAVFLDVRDAESFAAGHIEGAVNIPYAELQNRLSELDPNQWIITYCT